MAANFQIAFGIFEAGGEKGAVEGAWENFPIFSDSERKIKIQQPIHGQKIMYGAHVPLANCVSDIQTINEEHNVVLDTNFKLSSQS